MNLNHDGSIVEERIIGKSIFTYHSLSSLVKKENPNVKDIDTIAKSYIEIGNKYNVRGDIAFCQAILETGWFRYDRGTAVEPKDHNYCGLGVVTKSKKGCVFDTIQEGVEAHIQHLYAYACKNDLPKGVKLVDIRYKYVKRGSAPTWNMLGGKWSVSKDYGSKIISIFKRIEGEQ